MHHHGSTYKNNEENSIFRPTAKKNMKFFECIFGEQASAYAIKKAINLLVSLFARGSNTYWKSIGTIAANTTYYHWKSIMEHNIEQRFSDVDVNQQEGYNAIAVLQNNGNQQENRRTIDTYEDSVLRQINQVR